METKLSYFLKIYQCIILTGIAILLFIIILREPIPYTLENVRSGKIKREQIPITRVTGSVDVDNVVQVDIQR